MKQLLLFIPFLILAHGVSAQCEPMFDFGDEEFGVAPDTVQNLDTADIDNFYSQQVDVRIPANAGFANLPFIAIDSASLAQITGLPDGLSFECNNPLPTPCTFPGDTDGCGTIAGVPTEGGTFDLLITALVYTSFTAEPIPFNFEGYRLVVNDPLSTDDVVEIEDMTLYPNPARDFVNVSLNAQRSGKGHLRLFDMVGKEISSSNVNIPQGEFTFEVNTADLPEGVYIYRLDAFGESTTRRLVVLH